MLPKIKALLEGSQQLYTKKSIAQGIVFIQRINVYRTRENLVTRVPVYLYHYIDSLTTLSWPLKGDRCFKATTSTFVNLHPNIISTLVLLRQSKKGGAWLLQDLERLELNTFNQILSPQLLGLLVLKDIDRVQDSHEEQEFWITRLDWVGIRLNQFEMFE